MKILVTSFMEDVQIPEARCFYGLSNNDGEHPQRNLRAVD
jgi:hypothetical protein